MRVVPAQGMTLRDPRTRRLVDPELGVQVDPHDVTFAWLLSHGDCVELGDDAYAAALARREAAETAAAAAPLPEPSATVVGSAALGKTDLPKVATASDKGADA